jgi:hypothetical protein
LSQITKAISRAASIYKALVIDRGWKLIRAAHIDALKVAITSAEGASGSRSISLRGRMDLPKAPTRSVAALVARSEMAAGCSVWMGRQNANRCANLVSVGTRFLGLFRPK